MEATTIMIKDTFQNSVMKDDFEGTIIHPQKWPEDLNYENKKVVVIGSGATAVTIVPAMAEKVSKINYASKITHLLYVRAGSKAV